MIKVGIIGATGYAGQSLFYLLHIHSKACIEFITSHNYADMDYSDVYKNYKGFISDVCIKEDDVKYKINSVDVIFTALPHGKSFDIVKFALEKNVKVIDIGSDFRIKDVLTYEKWYKVKHEAQKYLNEAIYGLPEINREKIKSSRIVANPGCYPTSCLLALMPALKEDLIDKTSIIIDSKSGVSGAGRAANIGTLFCECSESIKAYGVCEHRHIPEIEQELSNISGEEINIIFTPHLVPMIRGILSVCYLRLKKDIDEEMIYKIYKSYYSNEPFVRVVPYLPETRYVKGSNICDISLRVDKRTGSLIIISAIDNLIKGAAGQAVQNMNLMFGIDEASGLKFPSMIP
ncbi:N-acetyl-gamma-glutamyl-phosphate reductase [Caloramator quimbayensis]|uniref:N-acetyl-gamma-glutamyl-phosphate reductase n=1 Tax=Caloramator quimbayensis TaxID=1147123 RepID=A0A1T4XFP1_9CLOT|nr:N-acetyl-gamma-glutamyl-phosphate reductase [Caloramator quimbayensis]SKA88018.1 N-acetyl-gamma-glutamyl-phosphate reductase [Caloramator quimbayensis]